MMTPTHCPYCAMQCGMNLHLGANGWEVAARDFPTNRGGLCRKGWTAATLLSHPERLTAPLLRREKSAPLKEVSWDEALDFIAEKVASIQESFGRDAIGVFGGGGLTNEKTYLLGKWARVALRTANIDYNGRFCMSSAASAGNKAFGLDRGMPFPMPDIARADTVLLIGSNMSETLPLMAQWFEALRENGGQLIVVDPRATATTQNADIHLQITPGADLALANGLLYIAIEEELIDADFIAHRTADFELAQRAVTSYWPQRVEQLTGIDEQTLRDVARFLAAGDTIILTSRGAEQHANGTDTVLGFINLALALGKAGKPFNGYGCLTGQGNGQGGREHGQKADQLPGYRKIEDETHRREVAAHWGVAPESLPRAGKSAYEMLDEMGQPGGVQGLFVFASNVAVSSPRAGKTRRNLEKLELLVVSDIFLSETAELADVVLPTTQWAEESGTMTNLEGRVLLRNQATEPPAGVRSDAEFLYALAARWGCGDKFPTDPREIFEELCRVTKGAPADYSGITYERITQSNGVFWPCTSKDSNETEAQFFAPKTQFSTTEAQFFATEAQFPKTEAQFFATEAQFSATEVQFPKTEAQFSTTESQLSATGSELGAVEAASDKEDGTPRMFLDRFAHPDGRARFHDVRFRGLPEAPDAEYPLYFTTGRVMSQYQSGAQTRRVPELNAMSGEAFVEINPALALEMGIEDGETVRVVSRRGAVLALAKLSDGTRSDTLFMPFHWGGKSSANLLTIPALDPISKMPEFKVCAARIEKIAEAKVDGVARVEGLEEGANPASGVTL